MRSMKRYVIALSVFLVSIASGAQELTILHLNDTHSHIEPERSGKKKGLGGVIEQAAYIDSVRQAEGKDNVLLLHAGDFLVDAVTVGLNLLILLNDRTTAGIPGQQLVKVHFIFAAGQGLLNGLGVIADQIQIQHGYIPPSKIKDPSLTKGRAESSVPAVPPRLMHTASSLARHNAPQRRTHRPQARKAERTALHRFTATTGSLWERDVHFLRHSPTCISIPYFFEKSTG